MKMTWFDKYGKILLYSAFALIAVGFLFCSYVFNWIDGRVTYVVNGEEFNKVTAIRTKHFSLPEEPSVEGYDFAGWYYDDGTFEKEFKLSDLPSVYFLGRKTVYAKLIEQHKHTYVSQIIEEPTCAKPGSKGDVCTHEECDSVINLVTIPELAHSIKDGVINKNVNGKVVTYDFVGSCDVCKQKLDKKNVTVTEKILSVESCLQDGKYEYTYVEKNISCVYTEIVNKLSHTLNGKLLSAITDANGGFVELGTENVFLDEDAVVVCGAPTEGHFVCDVCERFVPVNVKKSHSETSSVVKAPTCTESGVARISCDHADCMQEIRLEEIVPLGHDAKFTLTKTGTSTYKVSTDCLRSGCDLHLEETIKADTVTSRVTKNATCKEKGERVYTCVYNGVETTFIESIPTTPHTSEGKLITSKYFENGKVNIDFPGLCFFGNSDPVACEQETTGYYFCDVCDPESKSPIFVRVYMKHSYTETTVKEPTCTETGTKKLVCKHCNAETTKTIPAKGHKYEWTLVIDNLDGDYGVDDIVKATCKCTGCTLTGEIPIDVAKDNVSYSYVLPVTCTERARHVYTFSKSNTPYGNVTVKNEVRTTIFGTHYLNGKPISELAGDDGIAENDPAVTGIIATSTLKFSIDGVYLFGTDKAFSCYNVSGKIVMGWYICDKCDTLREYPVYVDHFVEDDDWVVVTEPTCGVNGVKKGVCGCGETVYKEIAPTGNHDIYYCLENSADNGGAEDSLDICKKCSKCDTQYTKVRTIKKTEAQKTVISLGTCCDDGVVKYAYTYSGRELVCEVNVPGPHFLNGVNVETLRDANGYLPSNIEGIFLLPEYTSVADGDKVIGGFKCSECEGYIESSVIIVIMDDEE